jgi:hypothetical protein
VRVYDAAMNVSHSYPLPGAKYVTFDSAANLVVATEHAVYVENADGDLALRYRSDNDTIHGIAAAGSRIWYTSGTEIGTIDSMSVTRSMGLGIAADATITGSPSGDVWVLAGGNLRRFTATSSASTDACSWVNTIRPVFARACASCHLPGGEANVDLSTFDAWDSRRMLIYQRVVVDHSMPPAGNPITDGDRMLIANWAMRQ